MPKKVKKRKARKVISKGNVKPKKDKDTFDLKFFWLAVLALAVIVVVIVLAIVYSGSSISIQSGDTVNVDYTGMLEDGTVFDTSIEGVGLEAGLDRGMFEPIKFTIGQGALIPGFENAIIGMKEGETKTVVLPPELAYGETQEDLIVSLPVSQEMDRFVDINKSDFVLMFGVDPVVGGEVSSLDISWPMKVISVRGDTVNVENIMKVGEEIEMAGVGWTTVVQSVDEETISLKQSPVVGDTFTVPSLTGMLQGVVISIDSTDFKIDLNHPLAGQTLVFDITVLSLEKEVE